MNTVQLIGRLTRDPQVTYKEDRSVAFARFSIAIDRGKDRNGEDRGADFPSVVAFGKTAELVDKYVHKGKLVGITGRIQTGSYEKDGQKVYTTDVVADRVEFLSKDEGQSRNVDDEPATAGFTQMDLDDIPFE